MIQVEVKKALWVFNRSPLRFKVVQFETKEDGSRVYYGSRSFEGREAAEQYKRQVEEKLRKEGYLQPEGDIYQDNR